MKFISKVREKPYLYKNVLVTILKLLLARLSTSSPRSTMSFSLVLKTHEIFNDHITCAQVLCDIETFHMKKQMLIFRSSHLRSRLNCVKVKFQVDEKAKQICYATNESRV